MKKILLTISIVVLFISCSNIQETKPEKTVTPVMSITEVSKDQYILTNIFNGAGLTLGFDEEGRVFGYSGLNRFFGKAKIENGNILIDPLASTRMGGSREAMIREDQYLSLLKSMTKIEKENGVLILRNSNGEKLIFTLDGILK